MYIQIERQRNKRYSFVGSCFFFLQSWCASQLAPTWVKCSMSLHFGWFKKNPAPFHQTMLLWTYKYWISRTMRSIARVSGIMIRSVLAWLIFHRSSISNDFIERILFTLKISGSHLIRYRLQKRLLILFTKLCSEMSNATFQCSQALSPVSHVQFHLSLPYST